VIDEAADGIGHGKIDQCEDGVPQKYHQHLSLPKPKIGLLDERDPRLGKITADEGEQGHVKGGIQKQIKDAQRVVFQNTHRTLRGALAKVQIETDRSDVGRVARPQQTLLVDLAAIDLSKGQTVEVECGGQ
jgi:hypothetical protein